jgi:HK97 family phage major capsid protein
MNELKLLLEQRADKENAFEALVNLAKGRTMTEAEIKQLDDLEKEIEELDKKIEPLQKIEARSKKLAAQKAASAVGAPQDNYSEKKEFSRYSYKKAFADIQNKGRGLGSVTGLEKEINDEAIKEASESGLTLQGNILIPARMIQYGSRLLDVATEGTDVVRTEYKSMIPSLRIDPVVDRLGITKYTGLKGNIKIPRSTNEATFAWETENSSADEFTLAFDAIDLSPKRLAGYTDISGQMLVQSEEVTEAYIRSKIEYGIAAAIDAAFISGATGGDNPVGIINTSGVNVVSLGTSGGDLTWGAIVALLTAPMADNSRDGNAGWLFNTDGYAALLRTPTHASGVEGNFILRADSTTLLGRRFIVSNRVPNDLTETATGLSALIYSTNWRSAILATWGGVGILFDPYTQALVNKIRVVVNTYADVDIEQPQEFAVVKDWITTTPAAT